MPDDIPPLNLFEAFAGLLEGLAGVRAATAGYRQSMITEHGFSETAAEAMAMDFHRMVMRQINPTPGASA